MAATARQAGWLGPTRVVGPRGVTALLGQPLQVLLHALVEQVQVSVLGDLLGCRLARGGEGVACQLLVTVPSGKGERRGGLSSLCGGLCPAHYHYLQEVAELHACLLGGVVSGWSWGAWA